MNLTQLVRRLVATGSTSSQGSLAFAKEIHALAQELGLQSWIEEDFIEGQIQCYVYITLNTIRPKTVDKPYLVFFNHMDTPEPGPLALWEKNHGNPYDLAIENETYYGLGVAENKADIAAKLLALFQYQDKSPQKRYPLLLLSFGHHQGMKGTHRWLKKNLLPIDFVSFGMPTQLELYSSVSGYARIHIEIPFSQDEMKFRNYHMEAYSSTSSSRLIKGDSNISFDFHNSLGVFKEVFEYFKKLPFNTALIEFDGGLSFNSQASQAFVEVDLSGNLESPSIQRINNLYDKFSQFHLELKNNNTPLYFGIGSSRTQEDRVVISGIVRISPHLNKETLRLWQRTALKICREEDCEIQILDFQPPFDANETIKKNEFLSDFIKNQNLIFNEIPFALSSEICLFGRKNILGFGFGPGSIFENLHTPKESVKITEVEKASQIYTQFIEEACL